MMKTFSGFLFPFLVIFSILVFSCQEEDDDLAPFINDRDKFLGSWSVNDESCQKSRYMVAISADPSNSSQVLLSNFGFSQSALPDTAIIAGTSIVLSRQVNSEKWIISGSGKLQDNSITWAYNLEISGDLLSCTATYRK